MTTSLSLNQRFFKELKELLYLSGPILGAQLATAGMTFVDTSMAGQFSARDLAAVAIGSSIWVPIYLLVRGTLLATTPTVAHLFGARQDDKIASPVRQALWLALMLSLLVIFIVINPEPLLNLLQVESSLTEITQSYLAAMAWGIPAICLYTVLVCYCEGRSITKPAMLISFFGLFLNIPLNYIMIYGKLGLPAMGGVGCGYATAICYTVMAVLMFLYIQFSGKHKNIALFNSFEFPSFSAIAAHIKLGLPMGLAIFFEASIFSAVALVIGKLGATIVAGHQIALNLSSLFFMVPLSMSMGITIRVGQAMGAGNPQSARFSGLTGLFATLMTATFSALTMWLCADALIALYTTNPVVTVLAAELLMFAAVFQYSDGVQIASNGALRGYKDTRVPMIIILIACWGIALPFGYILGLTDWIVEPMGPHGLWVGLVTALTISAAFLLTRFLIMSRRQIEKEMPSMHVSQAVS